MPLRTGRWLAVQDVTITTASGCNGVPQQEGQPVRRTDEKSAFRFGELNTLNPCGLYCLPQVDARTASYSSNASLAIVDAPMM